MWSQKKSLLLSKLFTLLFLAGVAAVLATAPMLVKWLRSFSYLARVASTWMFYATLYGGGLLAGVMLVVLFRLLLRIGRDEVFTVQNVAALRAISWCCLVGAVISAASGLYYVAWWIVAVAAAFVGLIVRVVKNVVAQAVELKEESDFTI